MKHKVALILFLLTIAAAPPREPVIGGPCEGCENVFVDLPAALGWSSRIGTVGEDGEPLVIEGTVRKPDGTPAAGIIVYAYQTNAAGIYPDGSTRHGALRAWVRSDDRGRYRFDSVRPGSYPGTTIAQHVHMHVIEPGIGTYYVDDIHFDDDPLLTARQRSQGRERGGSGIVKPRRDQNGVWKVQRDITLGLNIPGYPG